MVIEATAGANLGNQETDIPDTEPIDGLGVRSCSICVGRQGARFTQELETVVINCPRFPDVERNRHTSWADLLLKTIEINHECHSRGCSCSPVQNQAYLTQ